MKIELSKQEIELLEGVLFDAIIKAEIDTLEREELQNLKYKLWKIREGISL